MSDKLWYKDAIIYQLHVRSFADSDGDGVGDFIGLTQKLDYLQDLGITAIWLMPFYPSPLRDDGYDIADYENINPQYGTLDDFRRLLEAAHERDLRVITELVINHTSDQHPWFQRARRAPPGSTERDFYVWSDTPEKYLDARIIFQDFEPSNWTYDRVAQAYFWHRFYSHQPDLNYDNPAVREAIFPLLDFWFDMGVDGLRLDAVPYLYEREGTNCENLPETHAFLRELRRHIDNRYQDRMLLAEANQWPEDAVAYFGKGDECHMAFHFPVMPRLFMGIHREDRFPLVDILDQTPEIPANCQWAMFLRNHDELTLEMVTDEERDYMYRAYASDSQARINLGIRRRLAPLLSNNRRRIELMNGLLFSLPGTPIIYYGDEIGMGDNIYLGDRNGVRTPMQWSADRNAGFSRANPQKLLLPIIIDPEYHYEAINVEAQQNNPHSLLWWMKRLIDTRQRTQALGRGALEFLHPDNRKVLAFLRKLPGEAVLVVANLSRFVQYVELDLSAYVGHTPVEFVGGTPFPPIDNKPFFLTLTPHAFLWFHLRPPPSGVAEHDRLAYPAPILEVKQSWHEVLGLEEDDLEQAVATYFSRWSSAPRTRAVKNVRVRDSVLLPADGRETILTVLQLDSPAGSELALLPLSFAPSDEQGKLPETGGQPPIAEIAGGQCGLLRSDLLDGQFAGALLHLIAHQRRLPARSGAELIGWHLAAPGHDWNRDLDAPFAPPKTGTSQVTFHQANRWVLKVFSRLDEGWIPEVELGSFLQRAGLPVAVAGLLGAVDLRTRRGSPLTLAVLQEHVPSEGDAQHYFQDAANDLFERVLTLDPDTHAALAAGHADRDAAARDLLGADLELAGKIAQRLAELHVALASDPRDPNFAPEPFTPLHQRSLYQSLRGRVLETLEELRRVLPHLSAPQEEQARAVLACRDELLAQINPLRGERIGGYRIRCHGDFHLGHLLFTGKDFVIASLEGDRGLPLGERRIKRSPLSDAACLRCSLENVGRQALAVVGAASGPTPGGLRFTDLPRVKRWLQWWLAELGRAFAAVYRDHPGIAPLLPAAPQGTDLVMHVYRLEQTLQELDFALREHPDRLPPALDSLHDLVRSRSAPHLGN
jgi:maltose alpha-D-glucosyltransferase/alpha-amylase